MSHIQHTKPPRPDTVSLWTWRQDYKRNKRHTLRSGLACNNCGEHWLVHQYNEEPFCPPSMEVRVWCDCCQDYDTFVGSGETLEDALQDFQDWYENYNS